MDTDPLPLVSPNGVAGYTLTLHKVYHSPYTRCTTHLTQGVPLTLHKVYHSPCTRCTIPASILQDKHPPHRCTTPVVYTTGQTLTLQVYNSPYRRCTIPVFYTSGQTIILQVYNSLYRRCTTPAPILRNKHLTGVQLLLLYRGTNTLQVYNSCSYTEGQTPYRCTTPAPIPRDKHLTGV